MWTGVILGFAAALGVAFVIVYRKQRGQIRALDKAREKIQLEERRVFDFLHGLGEALSEDARPDDLHRLIVEGAMRIVNAHGGSLYLADEKSGQLRPAHISKTCPALFEVPAKSAGSPDKLHSYLRLHAIAPWDGVPGLVWKEAAPLLLSADDPRLDFNKDAGPSGKPAAVAIAPLIYHEKKMGLLAVARIAPGEPFVASEFDAFKTIAEQSAFALYNVFITAEATEKKRLDQDLQVAYEIQRILLPANSPDVSGYQISGINIPAKQVSGDYYDYIAVDDSHCGVAIADVSGKGVPASLIMAMCRSVLRSLAPGQLSPSGVLHRVNSQIYPDIKEDMFISMAYVILDKNSSSVTLSRAGHDAPLLYRASDKTVSKVNPPGMAVGIDSGDVFNRVTGDFSLTLEAGDCLILYTDGVTEALDKEGEEFGMDNVIRSIQASAPEGAAAMITRLTDDLWTFVGARPQNDDITLIAIRKK